MAQEITTTALELNDLTTTKEDDDAVPTAVEGEPNYQSLPPADGGRAAWQFLIAAFIFESLLWGFPLSFGVFQNYYSQLPKFSDSRYISVIGTIASGMAYLAAPVIIPLIRRFSKYRRRMIWIGWPICLLGLVAGSFAQDLGTLILTQGIMYGAGFIVFYYPILEMLTEYWIARRGMAAGIMCAASGVSGSVFPFAIEKLLQRYGYPKTLRAIALGLFVITGPLIPLLKGRLPDSETSTSRRTDWSFVTTPSFWIYSVSNFAMGLGYFFPSLYIPSYARTNGLSSTQGALLLALMSIAQVLGQFSFGYLSDRQLPLQFLAGMSTFVAATAVYTCWGLAHTFAPLVGFTLLYGFFGAGYTALWMRMGTAVSSDPTGAFAAFGLLNFGKGVGNVLAGPLSGALLLRKGAEMGRYGAGEYERVVLFTGSCMLASAVVIPMGYIARVSWSRG